MQGILGRKIGMTRVFDAEGHQLPVTVIEIGPCVVVQVKTKATDGYEAIKVGFREQKESRVTKALRGEFKKAGVAPRHTLREFALEAGDSFKAGDMLTEAVLNGFAYVDVTGISKGRGFQGVVKRFRMRGGPMTHGGHSKRRIGSIGCRSYPGRVHKGKHMPVHMGNVTVTQKNLRVVQLRADDHLLLVQGAIPGAAGEVVAIHKAKMAEKAKTT
jgi:large subunit ribosomal protein L3